MPSTIRDLTELTTVAVDDYLLVSDTSDVTNRDKRISVTNLQLPLPKKTGTPVLGRITSWLDANTIQDSNVALSDLARLSQANTFAGLQTFNAGMILAAGGLYSASVTLGDDQVYAFGVSQGIVIASLLADSGAAVMAHFRATSSNYCVSLGLAANSAVRTGVMTGTTGVDGQFTVSADTTGLFIENRRGTSRTLRLLVLLA